MGFKKENKISEDWNLKGRILCALLKNIKLHILVPLFDSISQLSNAVRFHVDFLSIQKFPVRISKFFPEYEYISQGDDILKTGNFYILYEFLKIWFCLFTFLKKITKLSFNIKLPLEAKLIINYR